MKQMTAERTKGDRARREKKRLEKEMASLNDQYACPLPPLSISAWTSCP